MLDYSQPYKGDLPVKLNRTLNPSPNLEYNISIIVSSLKLISNLSFLSRDTTNTSMSITPRNTSLNGRGSLRKEMDYTLQRIDEFYGQMKALENT